MSDQVTLLTPRQVAERLSVSTRTVYAWLAEGRLPEVRLSERVTRVPKTAVDEFIARSTTRSSTPPAGAGTDYVAAEAAALYTASTPAAQPALSRNAAETPSERLRALLNANRDAIAEIVRGNRADNVRVFGSVASGEARDDSDIDLLIDPMPGMTLFDLGRISWRLEELLGIRVDVVPARSLREAIRERVLEEAVPL